VILQLSATAQGGAQGAALTAALAWAPPVACSVGHGISNATRSCSLFVLCQWKNAPRPIAGGQADRTAGHSVRGNALASLEHRCRRTCCDRGCRRRFLSPGPNNPQGFLLTTVLGIAGALVSTWIGQTIGWYRPDPGGRNYRCHARQHCLYWSSGTAWPFSASSMIRVFPFPIRLPPVLSGASLWDLSMF
jgi:hypothetical protein